jgi:hypothetical protein
LNYDVLCGYSSSRLVIDANIIMNQRTRKVIQKKLDLSPLNVRESMISIMMCLMILLIVSRWMMQIVLGLLSHFASISMNGFHLIPVSSRGECLSRIRE